MAITMGHSEEVLHHPKDMSAKSWLLTQTREQERMIITDTQP